MLNNSLYIRGLALFVALSATAFAAVPEEEGTSSIQTEAAATAPADQGRFTGLLEIRPTFITEGNEFHTENLVDVGYQFNKNFRVTVQQAFNTNLSDPWRKGASQEPMLQQGFIRATFSNLANIDGWSLTYEPRVYIPENEGDFNSRRHASLRNYVMLSKTWGNYSLTFMEIPIFHWYGARGYYANGAARANQYYENRFYIMNDFTFGKLSISLPILFVSQSKLDFAGTEGDWAHSLWFWPEIAYAVDPNVQVGFAIRTESIVAPDLSGFTVTDYGTGLSHSYAQFLLRASI